MLLSHFLMFMTKETAYSANGARQTSGAIV